MTRILLTGGTGYLGSHTALTLLAAGYEVVLFDNFATSHKSVIKRIQDLAGNRVPFVEGDVLDQDLLQKVLIMEQIDAVVHFAGLKSVSDSAARPLEYFANNVAGTLNLLNAMRSSNLKTLVFSSSATIYGAPMYLPVDEKHPKSVTNPYGRTKLQIEEILADIAASDKEWRISCLRYFNPVGAHPSGLIGEDSNQGSNNLMPNIVQVARGARDYLSIYGNDYETPDGTGVRDFIHVMDLAEGHVSALEFLRANEGIHSVNLGTGRGYSVLEMVKTFETVSGRPIPCRFEARREGDVGVCYADSTYAKRLFGWSASRDLEDMCLSAWKFLYRA